MQKAKAKKIEKDDKEQKRMRLIKFACALLLIAVTTPSCLARHTPDHFVIKARNAW